MALADTAKLIVDLSLKGNFATQLAVSQRQLKGFDKQVDSTGSRAYKAGTQIGVGIKRGAVIAAGSIGFLATQVGLGLRSLSELESITTQTNAVLKSTKGVSGETADSIRKLAEQYESLNATIDDKVIQSGENLLLTFTNIRKDAFEPALKAALDMNTALGRGEEGLQGTIQQLGVALNDPIKGLQRLQRAGITFTKTQKDQIAAAVKAGDTFKAQSIILAELNKRYGGSFLAGGQTTTGKIAKFKDAIEDLQKALATALLPTIGKIADALTKFLADPKVIAEVSRLGDKIAGLFSDENLTTGANVLKGAFETFKSAAPFLESAAKATLGFIQAAVGVFKSLPEPLQALVAGGFALNKLTGGLVTNVAGGIADLIGKARGATPANPVFVSQVGLAGGIPQGGAGKFGSVASAVGKVFLVGAAVGVFAELKGILDDQSAANRQQAAGLSEQTTGFTKVAGIEDMKKALAGIDAKIHDLNYNITAESFAFSFNIDGVKDAVNAQREALVSAITTAEQKAAAMQVHATERAEAIASSKADALVAAQRDAAMAVHSVERREAINGSKTAAGLQGVRGAVQATGATNHSALLANARQVGQALGSTATKVTGAIARARAAQVAAALQTTRAVKNKDLSVTVNNTIPVSVNLSNRTMQQAIAQYSKYYKVPT